MRWRQLQDPASSSQGVAGFVPEGGVVAAHLWNPWPGAALPAEVRWLPACRVLAGTQESSVLVILGNGIDTDRVNGTLESLGQPGPGRSPCQG